MVTHTYDRPHYVSVSKASIDDIGIDIKTDQNRTVDFRHGKVILKLSFRPVKHRFGV